ncbi:MAG: tetratricopeptide repeat protein [Spirochaetes bacterium]|nr:tetratricopeptide repeat protein [Spirochaetota bacterium]
MMKPVHTIILPALLIAALLSSVVILTSCGDMSCRERPYLSNLRAKKTSNQRIVELRDRIDSEMRKGEDRRATVRIGEWYTQLGEQYLQQKSWDHAIESFQKGITFGQQNPGTHYSLGVAFANRGKELGKAEDFAQAEHHYRRSLEFGVVKNEAGYALAILQFYHLDRKEEALGFMEGYIAQNKKLYRARFGLGKMYYEAGKHDRALAVYEDLYADLQKLRESPMVEEYKNACRENISRLTGEMSRKK